MITGSDNEIGTELILSVEGVKYRTVATALMAITSKAKK